MTSLLFTLLFLSRGPVGDGAQVDILPTVLVVYDTRTGSTGELAREVARGVENIEGISARLRTTKAVSDEDIREAAGILMGSPVHWAGVSSEMRAFLERVGNVLLTAKELGPESTPRSRTGGAFVTAGAIASGKELARVEILSALLNMRFIIVGGEESDGFGTLGAQATTGERDPGLSEQELEEARRFGERFARVTLALVR
ncbi:MAG TPA: flavodoxin family protein [Vicinamibacteria bacterium]|nr:flavodoxin family protein [Vicinamibacteria bacterium]